MVKAYADGLDLYAWIASSIYSVPYEDCKEFFPDGTKNPEGKKRRSSVKAIILGIMYSKGEKAVAEDLGISLNEAKDIFSKLFTAFPKIRKFIDDTQHLAATQGYVMTAWGRKRRLPDMLLYPYEFSYKDSAGSEFDPLDFSGESATEEEFPEHLRVQYTNLLQSKKDKRSRNATIQNIEANGISVKDNTYIISEASRQCVNSVIQGSAADMIKVSMINIYNDPVLRSHGFKLLLQVHDELIGECPIEHAQLCSNRLSEIMINSAKEKISTPMKCDAEITKCWYGDQVTV